MIERICAHINNYFEVDSCTNRRMIYPGTYTIENGGLVLPFLANGQYFRIMNSKFNDGVYEYPAVDLKNETFDGVIWEMRPPKAFLNLVGQIAGWVEKYGEAAQSPYQSENMIGVYSYARNEGDVGWQQAFRRELNPYRKLA